MIKIICSIQPNIVDRSGVDHGGHDHQGLISCADRVLRATTAVDDAKDSSSKIITW
jgi:hypothetical protein